MAANIWVKKEITFKMRDIAIMSDKWLQTLGKNRDFFTNKHEIYFFLQPLSMIQKYSTILLE